MIHLDPHPSEGNHLSVGEVIRLLEGDGSVRVQQEEGVGTGPEVAIDILAKRGTLPQGGKQHLDIGIIGQGPGGEGELGSAWNATRGSVAWITGEENVQGPAGLAYPRWSKHLRFGRALGS